jgi:hypothetical protein
MCFYANEKKHPLTLSDVRYPLRAGLMYEEAWHNKNALSPYLSDPAFASRPQSQIPTEIRVNAIYFDCHIGTCALPYLKSPYCLYSGYWYWYDKFDNKIPDSAGISQGWDLKDGVHDRQ